MKTCKKCAREWTEEDFGSQAYCRECWRKYDRERAARRRVKSPTKRVRARLLSLRVVKFQYPELWATRLDLQAEYDQIVSKYASLTY